MREQIVSTSHYIFLAIDTTLDTFRPCRRWRDRHRCLGRPADLGFLLSRRAGWRRWPVVDSMFSLFSRVSKYENRAVQGPMYLVLFVSHVVSFLVPAI